jgi:ribosomal protein S18 acetylase RimI-like enzyme
VWFLIRRFNTKDYDNVVALWTNSPGVGLRFPDDSKEGIEKFIKRNPNTSFVVEENGKIVGTALCGQDGRRGYLYHVCVEEGYRRRSIGRLLIEAVIKSLKEEGIVKIGLVCFSENEKGKQFWRNLGWEHRKDLDYYTISIDN